MGTGSSECEWVGEWLAYQCHDIDHQMMIIESLDADTELRRVSPVAVVGDGHIDLVSVFSN